MRSNLSGTWPGCGKQLATPKTATRESGVYVGDRQSEAGESTLPQLHNEPESHRPSQSLWKPTDQQHPARSAKMKLL